MNKPILQSPLLLSWLSLAAVGFLSSCERQDAPQPGNSYFVTQEQAQVVAQNIAASSEVQMQYAHNRTTADTQQVFVGREPIRTVAPVYGKDGQPAFYAFNYQRGGFALVAADRHMRPILAFNEHGRFQVPGTGGAVPEGLAAWVGTTQDIVAALRTSPAEQNTEPMAKQAWAKLSTASLPASQPRAGGSTKGAASRPLPPADPNPFPCGSNQVGPLLQIAWGQGFPYNENCPLVPTSFGSTTWVHAVTGCVATAMAQVMYYWKWPNRFNWPSMTNGMNSQGGFYSSNADLAWLMQSCGDDVGMSYGANGSSANSANVPGALRNNFGYASATYGNYQPGSFQTVKDNLTYGWPVLLGGYRSQILGTFPDEGHLWVCDGYLASQCDGYSYLSFHMNWGWNGQGTGWFNYNNWTVTVNGTTRNYQYSQDMVYNIHP